VVRPSATLARSTALSTPHTVGSPDTARGSGSRATHGRSEPRSSRRRDLGVLTGHLPATRNWERADRDLLDSSPVKLEWPYATPSCSVGSRAKTRNCASLTHQGRILRGVSHNLQTPLTSIRAYVEQLRRRRRTPRRIAVWRSWPSSPAV